MTATYDMAGSASGSSGAPWTTNTGPLFYVVEVDYRNFNGTTGTLLASDRGYRTGPSDSIKGGVVVYPPTLDSAFAIDRRVNLAPDQPSTAAAWGTLNLANTGGRFDALAAAGTPDGQRVRIYAGRKAYDASRGYLVDPPFSALTQLFGGFATNWFCSDTQLQIPLRDASYLLERNVQTSTYGGTGGLDGASTLQGTLIPRSRGNVTNITPVLVDPTNRIYQWTDAPASGGVNARPIVYEGGNTNIQFQSDVSDLYTGTTTSGYYRTCAAKGLFQLGTDPIHQITVTSRAQTFARLTDDPSLTGYHRTGLHTLALSLLMDDFAVPSGLVDSASFTGFANAYDFQGGYYTSAQDIDGATLLGNIVAGIAAKVVPKRDGTLSLYALRALAGTETPVATYSRGNTLSVVPVALGANLDPPPWRYRVEYAHNWTVQTSDLSAGMDDGLRQFVSLESRYATWSSTTTKANYAKPNDPPVVAGWLTFAPTNPTLGGGSGVVGGGAQPVADALGALWGVRRRLYNVTVPASDNLAIDIGMVVKLVWPMDDLAAGKLGQVVGEQFRGGDATLTLQVLV